MKKFGFFILSLMFIASSTFAAQLAPREKMLEQLKSVSDDLYLAEKFYPILLELADCEQAPGGIALKFLLAEASLTEDLSTPAVTLIKMNLEIFIPRYFNAILPENPEEAAEALQAYRLACSA